MKLRNKKTGEIVEAHDIDIIDRYVYLKIFSAGDYDTKQYTSIAEFCEEWGDYEEPKTLCYITAWGDVYEYSQDQFAIKQKQAIGNYFETKQEAEKVVEKLKAWQRLKDKGFVWQGWEEGAMDNGMCVVVCQIPEDNWETDVVEDLDLLFGGEE